MVINYLALAIAIILSFVAAYYSIVGLAVIPPRGCTVIGAVLLN